MEFDGWDDKDKYDKDKKEKDKLEKLDKYGKDKEKEQKKDKDKDKQFKYDKEKHKLNKDKQEKHDKNVKDKVIKGDHGKGRPKKKKNTSRATWQTYIHKVLKTVHEDDCTLSSKAMAILDSFANDLFERISSEAVKLLRLNNKKTLTSMEIQTAARLVLPGELCKHAIQDGSKAVQKYSLNVEG